MKKRISEDNICPETGKPCLDECCPPGAICNLTGSSLTNLNPMPNKFFLREDRTAVCPTMEEPNRRNVPDYEYFLTVWDNHLLSLPALTVDRAYLKTLKPGWFEGVERYYVRFDKKSIWLEVSRVTYDKWRTEHNGEKRLTIIAPQEAEQGQEDTNKCLRKKNGGKQCKSLCEGCWELYKRPATPQPVTGERDPFIEKHLTIIKEKMKDNFIHQHIGMMWGGLEMASIQHFIDTGTINGSFRNNLIALINAVMKWQTNLKPANQGEAGEMDVVAVEAVYDAFANWYHDDGDYDTFLRSEAWKSIVALSNHIIGKAASRPSDAVELVSNTQMNIGRLEITCFNGDSEMSVRVGKSSWQSLTVDEAKELAHFIQSHIHHETSSNPSNR